MTISLQENIKQIMTLEKILIEILILKWKNIVICGKKLANMLKKKIKFIL